MQSHSRIPGERLALAHTQVNYLATVAGNTVGLGNPASEDCILYAFGTTPVPAGIDATTEPTAQEIAAVRALVLAAQEITG